MNTFPRRSFIKRSFEMAGAVALARAGWAAEKRASAAGKEGFQIFICDWTMQKPCDPIAFDLAERIGLDGVQVEFGRPAAGGGPLPLFAENKQDQLLAAAARHSMRIPSLAMGAVAATPYKSSPEAEQWVLDSIAVLKRMKVRVALLAFFYKNDLVDDPAGVEEVIRRLKRLAPRAEEAGVVFGIESWLKVSELERILDAVNSPAVQAYYDVGNMQKVGEDYCAAIRRLGHERICEIHLKDQDDLYGKGSMNFPGVRAALDDAGYRGWLGIEGLKLPLGIEESIRYDLEYLRPLFPRVV